MTIKNNKLNKIIKIATAIITIVAIIFVSERVITDQVWNLHQIDTGRIIKIVFIGGFFYFTNLTFLPMIWRRLLVWFGEKPKSFIEIYVLYGISQISKYVPGNIFHFATRHVMSLQNGSKNAPLLGATIFELIITVIGATTVCLIGYIFNVRYSNLSVDKILLFWGILILFLFTFIISLPKVIKIIPSAAFFLQDFQKKHKNWKDAFVSISPVFIYTLSFFMISGFIFYLLIIGVNSNGEGISISVALSIYSIAYLLGLITPGAPGGVGVRESIIIVLISGYTGNSQATLIALLSRLITVIGDLFFYLTSIILRNQKKMM